MTRHTSATLAGPVAVLLTAAAVHAAPVTLVSDTFADGGRTDGSDATDIAFWRSGSDSTLTVPTTGTGLTGNALRFDPGTQVVGGQTVPATFRDFLGFFPDADADGNSLQELAVGDVLQLQFDVRFETAPANAGAAFRFGVYNSNDTQQVNDNFSGGTDTFNNRGDDRGYFFGVNVGLTSTTGTGLNEEVNTDGALLGGSNATPSTIFDSVNAGTNPVTFLVRIERTGDAALAIGLAINGSALESFTDTTPVTTAFDEIAFGVGGSSNVFLVDDVRVTYTAVPEPSALAAVAAAVPAVLRRRRRRR